MVEEEVGWEDDWGVESAGVGVGEGDAVYQVRARILRYIIECSVTSGKFVSFRNIFRRQECGVMYLGRWMCVGRRSGDVKEMQEVLVEGMIR